MPLLRVEGLRTYFYTRRGVVKAVEDVSFDVSSGELLCLVGESGSGKTVTGLSILGLVEPPGRIVGGEITFDGLELTGLSQDELREIRGRRIAMIFQDPRESLNPVLTIGDQISEPMRYHLKLSRDEALERARELLEEVGIPEPERRLRSYPHELSGGMNQRVMIAIALSCNPDLLIADEPTSALDVTTQAQLLHLLLRFKRQSGMALMFITHDLGVVAEIADRVVVMYAGRVVEGGSVYDIFERPRHPYTIGLLNCLPALSERKGLKAIPGQVPSLINPPDGCVFHPRCRFARELCRTSVPAEVTVGQGHFAACHYTDSEEIIRASEEAAIAGEASGG